MPPLSRRHFLKNAAQVVLGGSVLTGCDNRQNAGTRQRQLNIYSWADYLPPEAICNFEQRYGVSVVYDTFASNEALLARMTAGSVDYDVIVPTNYAVFKLKQLKLLKPIDKDRVPNARNLLNRFTRMHFDPGGVYSVPYTFGTTGIGYNARAFAERGIQAPSDWEAFWDNRLRGRMTILEDARESIGLSLKRLGKSYNSVDEGEIAAATRELVKQKPLIMCYTSDQVIVYLGSGDSLLSLAYSGDAHQSARNNADIKYTIPASGASMWVDNMCIPASAPHEDLALLWINYILEPEVSASLTNYTYYPTPNEAARRLVNPELLADKTLYPPDSLLDKCEEIKDIGSGIFIYDRAWTELKCV
jgi:spermidine/putrescine-binding protein